MILTPLNANNVEELLELERKVLQDLAMRGKKGFLTPYTPEEIAEIENHLRFLYMGLFNSRPNGVIKLDSALMVKQNPLDMPHFDLGKQKGICLISHAFENIETRKQGNMTELLKYTMEYFPSGRHFKSIVNQNNEPGHKLFSKLGFEIEDSRKYFIDGKDRDYDLFGKN